jgi:hypothetical protein
VTARVDLQPESARPTHFRLPLHSIIANPTQFRIDAAVMTDTPAGAPAPKKRSFFKRAAWQDAAKKDSEDIFSHSNEFNDLVAAQNRHKAEERRKAEEKRKNEAEAEKRRKQEQRERKKRRLSVENETPASPRDGSVPAVQQQDSLAARYETLTGQSVFDDSPPRKEPFIIDLGSSDDEADAGHNANSFSFNSNLDHAHGDTNLTPNTSLRPSPAVTSHDDDDLEDELDPELAALEAKARARAAARRAEATAKANPSSQPSKAPIAQLFIKTEIPNTAPLMVKVRIDTTLEKPREAWCTRQNFAPDMAKRVFFTWRRTRIFDSTTVKRLGMTVDRHGSVSIDGDSNIYDDENLPKVYVEAWTEEILEQVKREEAAEAAAQLKAASPFPIEEREPTPEPKPVASKIRVVLRAKGKEDFGLNVHPVRTAGFSTSIPYANTTPSILTLPISRELTV